MEGQLGNQGLAERALLQSMMQLYILTTELRQQLMFLDKRMAHEFPTRGFGSF